MAKDSFENALKNKHVPVLTLDNKWHKLFNNGESEEIKKQEAKINELLKEQGRINNELKDLKKIKNDLMNEIVTNMPGTDAVPDKLAQKKVTESKRLIGEVNDKIASYDDKLLDLPRSIDEENYKLMLLTMEECYDTLLTNTEDIEKIGEWIKNMRMELKRNILKKQQMEVKNVEMYSYMHDIFGPEVIEIFDIKYDVEAKKQAMLATQQARAEEKKKEEAKKEAIKNIMEGKVN